MARVLVACEFSGRVRDALIAAGHDAVSCDFLPTERPGPHYVGDVFDIINEKWDALIAHPPCTYLCNSGVRWLYKKLDGEKLPDPVRWDNMEAGAYFFKALLESDIPHIAIENPIMHKYAKEIIGRGQDQVIQPWMFGHPETKATCLWLKGFPPLEPTKIIEKEDRSNRLHMLPPSEDRWKIRSTTFQGIADAIGEQWGPWT